MMRSKRCRQKKGNQIGIYKFKEKHIIVVGDTGNRDKMNNVLVKGEKEVRGRVNKSYPVDPYSCNNICRAIHHVDGIKLHMSYIQGQEFKNRNRNASRFSEHSPVRGKKCQNV